MTWRGKTVSFIISLYLYFALIYFTETPTLQRKASGLLHSPFPVLLFTTDFESQIARLDSDFRKLAKKLDKEFKRISYVFI